MEKRGYFVLSALIVVVAISLIFGIGFKNKDVASCGDGSPIDSCSLNQPYFCDKGKLISNPEICGCPENMIFNDFSCSSDYFIGKKEINFSYFFDGSTKQLSFLIYSGVEDYISSLSSSLTYLGNESPSRADFKLRDINDLIQRNALMPLVIEIQNSASGKDDQARIAINLVQEISYGFSNKTTSLNEKQEIGYSRYPYDVVFDGQGVCGEKTELLLFLLRELGFKTAFFYYSEENHEAVGIGCPVENSLNNSGYCFVETTGSSIISDDSLVYVGGITLKSNPEIYPISDGYLLSENLPEYGDAKKMAELRNRPLSLATSLKLNKLINKYGLANEYNLI